MKYNIFMVILLFIISFFIYKNNKKNTEIVVYLSLLILTYVLLSIVPNFEHFKIYNNKDEILNLYQPISEEVYEEEISLLNNPVLYGDTILLKCLSKKNRYLTGGRGGNLDTKTNDLNEFVFSTNENVTLLEWKVKSTIDNDPKIGTPIKYGDSIYLKVIHINDRFLRGGIEMSQLPYSKNGFEAVGTLSSKFNNKNNMIWFVKNDSLSNRNNDPKKNQIVNYSNPIVLQSNAGNDLFLSGARGNYALDNSNDVNQEVYTVNGNDGNFELKWCFTKKKKDIDLLDCSSKYIKWPLWKFEPGFIGKNNWKNQITSSSCEGYSPFVNDIKRSEGTKSSDIIFGEPCISGNQDNACWKITKDSGSAWVAGNNKCDNEFVVINFGREVFIEKAKIYPRKDFPHNNQFVKEFSVKTGKKHGILLDLGKKFKTTFGISWFYMGAQIIIQTYNKDLLKINNDGNILKSSKTTKSDKLSTEIFNVIKNNDDTISFKSKFNTLIKLDGTLGINQSNIIQQASVPDSMKDCKFKIIENSDGSFSFKSYLNTYLKFDLGQLVQSPPLLNKIPDSWVRERFIISQINNDSDNYYEFDVNRTLQFLKIIPYSSNIGCAMRVSAYGKGSNVDLVEMLKQNTNIPIKSSSCMNYNNGKVSNLTDGSVCSYGGYETSKLNMFSNSGWSIGKEDSEGKAFLLIDLGKEQCVKGGILYSRDNYDDLDCLSCDQYVKKFRIEVAGNNKMYTNLGLFISDLKGNSPGKNKGYRFSIMKNNIRFVKMTLLKCNKYCSMRLDLY